MTRFRQWRQRPGDDERGASLVEFALVVPLFILLLFALIDFGLVFGGDITLRSQLNAAARNISVDQLAPGCATATYPFNCTAAAAIGSSLPGTTGTPAVAVAFPAGDSASPGAPVAVCAQVTLQSSTGLLGPLLDGRTVTIKSEVRLEQAPSQTTDDNPSSIPCTA